ncbi:MAG: hypothetical protein A3D92_20885 [Bacteroidetes bacterium RIFCSPHIGHO2_02_FULL_44_7]|nr:MAG: hypothetical protein A3D92_20885 [Bacteroidetes bacterium RIFCSPHIGHO2_02_FULL_44_7]
MLLFIIFGTSPVRSTIQSGHFSCPQCERSVPYRHRKVTKFFSLFFIPIFPIGSPMEYVECGSCNNSFVPRVLGGGNSSGEQTAGGIDDDFMAIYEKAIRHTMVMVMLADGHIDDNEKLQVQKIINKFGHNDLTLEQLDAYIEQVRTENQDVTTYLKRVGPSLNDHGKETVIKVALSVADADGRMDDSEIEMITKMATAMDLTASHLRGIIAEFNEKRLSA